MVQFQPITYSNQGPLINRLWITTLEYLNGRLTMERKYYRTLEYFEEFQNRGDQTPFFDIALNELKIEPDIISGSLDRIPKQGPLIVVANHPFGIVDGLCLASTIHKVRPDLQILANHALQKAEPMRKWLIPLDDSGTRAAEKNNRPAIMQAMRYVRDGGCLCIFPAGRVARPAKWGAPVKDYTWQEFAGRMVMSAHRSKMAAKILPVYFDAKNSSLFQVAYLLKMMSLRRALVVAEALKKQNQKIDMHIGRAISTEELPHTKDTQTLLNKMREMVFDLQPAPVYFPESYGPKTLTETASTS